MKRRRDEYEPEKLLRAQARRQAILDYLHAHPCSMFYALLDALSKIDPPIDGVSPINMRGTLANMLKKGEIAATGRPRQHQYIAIATVTESADELREKFLERQKKNNAKNYRPTASAARKAAVKATPVNTWNGGNIRHIGGSLPTGANQRGQGALRPRVTINCAKSY